MKPNCPVPLQYLKSIPLSPASPSTAAFVPPRVKTGSSTVTVLLFTVVVVPLTVRLPCMIAFPVATWRAVCPDVPVTTNLLSDSSHNIDAPDVAPNNLTS